MTDELFVSLGHNSSAVFARDGVVIRGYEQERIDRKKSSSAYPRDAIELAVGDSRADVAYVSHWFDDLTLRNNKYLDLDHLKSVAGTVVGLNDGFTHHDAHAQSAISFFVSNGGKADAAHVVVIDGFGTNQECFSVYYAVYPFTTRPKLMHRTYGYSRSLGLMYQYTTEYLGLKPNQDEYKLLGYEAHVLEYVPIAHLIEIADAIQRQADHHAWMMLDSTERPSWRGGLIDYDALKFAKAYWWEVADRWRKFFPPDLPEAGVRACVAFCAQYFLEQCVIMLLERAIPKSFGPAPHLVLTGGSFYNVKLSRKVKLKTGRKVFSHPLAGDQGAAMGFSPGLTCAGLTWGARTILGRDGQLPIGVEVVDADQWVPRAAMLLDEGHIVNVVRGGMEFGPRALCNTTTFAMPTPAMVSLINRLNERDDVMPMAPVITRRRAMQLFRHDELLDVPVSDRFMITTVAFKDAPSPLHMGVAHRDPLEDVWTARPQIVDEGDDVHRLLCLLPDQVLINTSFNYHGEPIVFTEDDACRTHEMQRFRAKTLGLQEPTTLLVRS